MTYNISDAGRAAAGIREKNDCTVRAFVHVAGVSYESAHAACWMNGRKPRHRFKNFDQAVQPIAKHLGIRLRHVKRSGTVNKLLAEFPSGRLLVRIRGHAFAIIDGVIHDAFETSTRAIVKDAWLRE